MLQGLIAPLVEGVVIYVLCLWPIARTAESLKGDRKRRFKWAAAGIAIAGGLWLYQSFVAGAAPNLYEVLGCKTDASAIILRKKFKKLKQKYSTIDSTIPREAQLAYDTLMDLTLRHLYNKFGMAAVHNDLNNEMTIIFALSLYYIFWLVLVSVTTAKRSNHTARNYAIVGLIALVVCEITMVFEQDRLVPWFLPSLAEFEIRELLRSLFPVGLALLQVYSVYKHEDVHLTGMRKTLRMATEGAQRKLVALYDICATVDVLERLQSGEELDAMGATDGSGAAEAPPRTVEGPAPLSLPGRWRLGDQRHWLYVTAAAYFAGYYAVRSG